MEAAINEVISADTEAKIDEFLRSKPQGFSRSYEDVMRANSKSATGWATNEIDSSVKDP